MSDLFFRNKRLLQLVLALIAVGGISSYSVLPRTEDPRLTKRNSLIITNYPGASAEQVESLVTEKIENRLEEIEEIYKLNSTSRAGVSAITIELIEEIPAEQVDEIWSRIRDKANDAAADLPPAALAPEFNDTDTEVDAYTVIAAFTWEDAPKEFERLHDVYDSGVGYSVLNRLGAGLEDRLRSVPGTKQTKLFGDPSEQVLLRVDPQTLTDLGLTASDVARRIAQADSKAPAGQLRGPVSDLLLEVEGEIQTVDRIREIPVASGPDGRVVRAADLGRVEKTLADPPAELAVVNGKPGIAVAARMETGQRIDQWAALIRAEIEAFQAQTPRGVELSILFDQSVYVEERLTGLQWNLVAAVLLVMSIVWFTMGWRSALLVGSALPVSASMAIVGMRMIDLPIHQMSVTGLIVALGLLIDNAIVMVDEVKQRLDDGLAPIDAVGSSVRHLAVPLTGSTLTSVFAFLPIVLLPGGGGEFVGPIALSVIMALLSSLFAALTIVPTLTGLFARVGEVGGSWMRRGFTDDDLALRYRNLLGAVFSRPGLGVAAALVLPVAGFLCQPFLQEQFFPPADRNQLQVQLRMPMQSSIEETLRYARLAREQLLAHEQVEEVHWFIGDNAPKFYYNMLGGDSGSPFYAQALVSLTSAENYFSLIRGLQTELDQSFPGAQFLALQLEQGPPFEAPIELHLRGPDLETLHSLGEQIRSELTRTEGVTHTLTTQRNGRPKIRLNLADEELRLAGLDNLSAARQLQASLDGQSGGSLLEQTEELPVRVVLDTPNRSSLAEVASLELLGAQGGVPLEALGDLTLEPEVSAITHRNGIRTNTIRGYIESGLLPSVVLSRFEARLAEADIEFPVGYDYTFGGEAEQRDDAVGDLLANISLLVILMVATLVLSFNSFRMAAVIGAVAMLSMGFAFLMLWLFKYPFGFVAIVGSMGLIGVAVNDSIVVLAALRENEAVGRGDVSAAVDVVARATRHVVTTTLTTMIGFSPLLLNGGEFWPPLAVSLGGGVIGATVLALLFVPSAYLMLVGRRARADSRSRFPAPQAAALLLLGLGLSASPAAAQTEQLSLRQAVDRAHRLSPEIQIAKLRTLESRGQFGVVRSGYLPQVNVSVLNSVQTSNLRGVGLTFPGFPSRVGPFQVFDARPTLNQTVLDLGLIKRMSAARRRIQQADFDAESLREAVSLGVIDLYLRTLQADARIQAGEARLATAETLLSDAQNFLEVGTGNRLDLSRASTQRETEVVALARNRLARQTTLYLLLETIGMPVDADVVLTENLANTPGPDADVAAAQEIARGNRPEVQAARAKVEAARFDVSGARAQRLPTIGFTADYGTIGERYNRNLSTYTIAGSLNLPIFQGGRIQAEIASAKSRFQQAEEELRDVENQVNLDVLTAAAQLDAARISAEAAARAGAAADEAVELARLRLGAGLVSNIDVVNAQQEQSRIDELEISALYDLYLARANLSRAQGDVSAFLANLN